MAADAKPWSLFEGLIQLKFESLAIAVVKPFNADERAVLATIAATTKFVGIELYVEVQYPGFYLSANQVGTTKVDLGYLQAKGVSLPKFLTFQFEIADIAIVADPGSYYSFSMRLGPGKSWKIDDQYTLPDLRLATFWGKHLKRDGPYLSWRFGARTNERVISQFRSYCCSGSCARQVGMLRYRRRRRPIRRTDYQPPRAILRRLAALEELYALRMLGAAAGQPNNGFTLDCRFAIEHIRRAKYLRQKHILAARFSFIRRDCEPLSFAAQNSVQLRTLNTFSRLITTRMDAA